MAVTMWTFLMLPDGTVDRYPFRRYERWFRRDCALGVAAGDDAKFVEVAIETRSGHPLRMIRVWFTRYELDSDGFVSVEHKERRMRDAANTIAVGLDTDPDSDVVSLEPFIARQRYRLDHSWAPDMIQLQRIAEAINHHAAKELVITDGRTLSPL
jgi:hypothetical protein